MLQLILHGVGDYFIQTYKWASNKKKKGSYGLWCCFIHCLTYSIPFLFIGTWSAVLLIFITHFIIDRTNLIAYLIAIKNNTKVDNNEEVREGFVISDTNNGKYDISNFGFSKETPFPLSIWLYIISDNLLHIICNYVSLKYL